MQKDLSAQAIIAIEKLLGKFRPQECPPMKSAVVALYTCDSTGVLKYSGLIGLLRLQKDLKLKSSFLRMYDLETLAVSFEIELYYNFKAGYQVVTDTLHMIDYVRGSIGLFFRNKGQADIMKMKIETCSLSEQDFEAVKAANLQQAAKKEEEGSFFSRFKRTFFSKDNDAHEEHESEIITVKKQVSMSFNLESGELNTNNIPKEWQEIFTSIKVSKEDLKNKDIVGVIVEETILHQAKKQAQHDNNKAFKQLVIDVEKEVQAEQKSYQQQLRMTRQFNLPPPPPPAPILAPSNSRQSVLSKRGNLMQEIRNNNIKLRHVEVVEKGLGINLNITDMNTEQRGDFADHLRRKLQIRRKALNRREASDDQS